MVEKMGLPGGYTPSLDSSDLLSMFIPLGDVKRCMNYSLGINNNYIISCLIKDAVSGGAMLLRE